MLEIKLMGSFSASLRSHDQTHSLSMSRRTVELLALFALSPGRFFHRSELGQLIGTAEAAAVSPEAVSTALWRLRRTIEREPASTGDFIVTNSYGAVGFCGTAPMSIDVSAFEQLARNGLGEPATRSNDAQIAALRSAHDLYKDCLLPGFFAEWILRERERLRRTYLDVLHRLMEIDASTMNYDGAIRSAQSILEADSLREDVHRALMRLLVLNGQRALALRQFEICRATLKRELAIQPMPETIAIYHQISDSATERLCSPAFRNTHPNLVEPAMPPAHAKAQTCSLSGKDMIAHLVVAYAFITQAEAHLKHSIDQMDR